MILRPGFLSSRSSAVVLPSLVFLFCVFSTYVCVIQGPEMEFLMQLLHIFICSLLWESCFFFIILLWTVTSEVWIWAVARCDSIFFRCGAKGRTETSPCCFASWPHYSIEKRVSFWSLGLGCTRCQFTETFGEKCLTFWRLGSHSSCLCRCAISIAGCA